MTNHWNDLKNSDAVLIIGANAAENHPMSFKWITHAMEHRGAKLIVVDPRFTRTAAKAHVYARLRPGTDIAFIGGIINYLLERDLVHKEYLLAYTNAAHIISDKYSFNDGLFSGYNASKRAYDRSSLAYEADAQGVPKRDHTLTHPRCVYQLLKAHFGRYDLDTVSRITGCPASDLVAVAGAFGATARPELVGSICYAMGTTQHTVGTQNVRAYAILQLLLGNIGRPGGGLNAMRGESNVQGSTDMALLFHLIPGYMRGPAPGQETLTDYLTAITPVAKEPDSVNFWKNSPKFAISLLKAWFGKAATPETDYCYSYLPKPPGNCSHIALFEAMLAGKIKGLIALGQNPAVGGPNAEKERKALDRLDWMVAVDLWETDTSVFWKRPGVDPKDIRTEVFLLPAASSIEKEGSVSNSGRWVQWRYKAVNPPGEAKSDLEILDLLYKAVRKLYASSTAAKDKPILDLTWDYGPGHEPNPHLVMQEINGRNLTTGKLLDSFAQLTDTGTTACGNWIISGVYTEAGNMAARREVADPTGLGLFTRWSWCWPLNRRILYNRCNLDAQGHPWDPSRTAISWNPVTKTWTALDVPDFVWRTPAGDIPPEKSGKSPYIMNPDGVASLFVNELRPNYGLSDGPFPEHYEPFESPVRNLMSSTEFNPATVIWPGELATRATAADYPLVATTYRVTEHWQAGAMTRNLPWLAELMPEMFVEVSHELAKERGIANGDTVELVSTRGTCLAKVCVTSRFKPFAIDGKTTHVIGMPWHYGFNGYVTGGPDKRQAYAANQLTAHIGDANTTIPEYKAFLCDLRKVK